MTLSVSTRRSGTALAAVLAAQLLQACLTENVRTKSAGPESRQLFSGPLLANPPPGPVVILRNTGGKLEAHARWMGVCSQTERRVSPRQLIVTKKVATGTYVLAGILGGAGLVLSSAPMAVAGALTFVIPTLQAREETRDLPPKVDDAPAPPAPCLIGYARREPIVVRGPDATLEGTTNDSGYILFDSTISGPVEVLVSGHPAQKVEWRK